MAQAHDEEAVHVVEEVENAVTIESDESRMAWRFAVSKYKNTTLTQPKKEACITELSFITQSVTGGNGIAASQSLLAFNIDGEGGKLGILPVNSRGRKSHSDVPKLCAHRDVVTDFAFATFDDGLLATCCQHDEDVRVWQLDANANNFSLSAPLCALPQPRAESVLFHPTASGLLTVAAANGVALYDLAAGSVDPKIVLTLADDALAQNLSWQHDGQLLSAIDRNRTLSVFDPRAASSPIWTVDTHDGYSKESRVLFLGDGKILTSGFTKNRHRELLLFDVRTRMKEKSYPFDVATGVLMPFFDCDTKLVVLAGKGSCKVSLMEQSGREPYLSEGATLTGDGQSGSILGACLAPKLAMDVMRCEVARLFVLVKHAIQPISCAVPRRTYRDFCADLFPDTIASEAGSTAVQWLAGSNEQPPKFSLNPAKAHLLPAASVLRCDGASAAPQNGADVHHVAPQNGAVHHQNGHASNGHHLQADDEDDPPEAKTLSAVCGDAVNGGHAEQKEHVEAPPATIDDFLTQLLDVDGSHSSPVELKPPMGLVASPQPSVLYTTATEEFTPTEVEVAVPPAPKEHEVPSIAAQREQEVPSIPPPAVPVAEAPTTRLDGIARGISAAIDAWTERDATGGTRPPAAVPVAKMRTQFTPPPAPVEPIRRKMEPTRSLVDVNKRISRIGVAGVRVSLFKHIEVKVGGKEHNKLFNLRNTNRGLPAETNAMVVSPNGRWAAVPMTATGLIAIFDLKKGGKIPDGVIHGVENGVKVLDYVWNPFVPDELVCALDNGSVQLWNVPTEGVHSFVKMPTASIEGCHADKLSVVRYHPLVAGVLATAACDGTVNVWELGDTANGPRIALAPGPQGIVSLAWSADGRFLAVAHRDCTVRLFEPRVSSTPIQEKQFGKENMRAARILFVCDDTMLLISCFSKKSQRQLVLVRCDGLEQVLDQPHTLSDGSQVFLPFYDVDTHVVVLFARGETNTFMFECCPEKPFLLPLSPWTSTVAVQALSFLPKNVCNVREVEVLCAYRMGDKEVDRVSFVVPRLKKQSFQNDVFPPAYASWKAASASAADWFAGADVRPVLESLRPPDMPLLI